MNQQMMKEAEATLRRELELPIILGRLQERGYQLDDSQVAKAVQTGEMLFQKHAIAEQRRIEKQASARSSVVDYGYAEMCRQFGVNPDARQIDDTTAEQIVKRAFAERPELAQAAATYQQGRMAMLAAQN